MITPRYHPIIPNRQEGVSKNGGTPKMDKLYNGKTLLKWMIWGGKPTIFGNTQELPAPQPSNTHAGTSNGFTFAAAPVGSDFDASDAHPDGTQQKRRTARYFFIKFGVTGRYGNMYCIFYVYIYIRYKYYSIMGPAHSHCSSG